AIDFGFLTRLFGGFSKQEQRLSTEDIEKAIDILVDGTDARLRLVSGYRRRLRKPVVQTLLFLETLCSRVPGPFEVKRKAFGADPQIRILAASADELQDLFSLSEPVRYFFSGSPASDVCYASLRMQRKEKKVFGVALEGDIVRKGVAQVAVNYSGHMIGVCAATEAEVSAQMKWRGFHSLVAVALERITNLKAKTKDLETQRALLKMKLREIKAQQRGLEVLVEEVTTNEAELHNTKGHLEGIELKLQESQAKIGTLDDYLRQVQKVLNHPASYLKVKRYSIHVSKMGIKTSSGAEVEGAEVFIGKNPPVDVMMVTYPRAEMRDEQYYRDRRQAYIHSFK
ncbi:MAG: hypothetical protein GY731_06685, partial [Gammaproteobacteria bacterium]|nr:hypothetical protein [Gammaproteobacteria bacterium]